jgi:hypothetical protein
MVDRPQPESTTQPPLFPETAGVPTALGPDAREYRDAVDMQPAPAPAPPPAERTEDGVYARLMNQMGWGSL